MSITVSCDHCATPAPYDEPNDGLPDGWTRLRMHVAGAYGRDEPAEVHLCSPKCITEGALLTLMRRHEEGPRGRRYRWRRELVEAGDNDAK